MPLPPKPYHHGNLRAVLLKYAEKLLSETGSIDLSMREVAKAAGVSHAAPRRHFADRHSLLDAVAASGFTRLGRESESAVEITRGNFTEQLSALAHVHVDFATRNPALMNLMLTHKERTGAENVEGARQRALAAPVALIRRAEASGSLGAEDAERLVVTVLALLQGLTVLVHTGMHGCRSDDLLVSRVVATAVEGIGVVTH